MKRSSIVAFAVTTALLAGCGGEPWPTATGIPLSTFVPTVGELGSGWTDLGRQVTSLDLTNPPSACSPYTNVFAGRFSSLVHEFTYLLTRDGLQLGHYATTIVAVRDADAPGRAVDEVTAPGYVPCAEATALLWFKGETEDTTMRAYSAVQVPLTLSAPSTIWRTTIAATNTFGSVGAYYLDIAYLSAPHVLVKIRIEGCGCLVHIPPIGSQIIPGEFAALRAVATRLAQSG